MHLGILGSPGGWYARDLRRAAKQFDPGVVSVDSLSFSDLSARLEGSHQSVHTRSQSLADFDALLVRSMPPGSLEQVIFRMDALHAVYRQGTLIVNCPRALEAAIDKYLSLSRLNSAGILVPRTRVTQGIEAALEAFHELGGDVVVKPLFGSEGRGMVRVSDPEIADRVFKTLVRMDLVLYLQQFIPNPGYDLRLLVIGQTVLGMRRHARGGWRANVAQGARTEALPVDRDLAQRAIGIAAILDAEIAAVDIVPGHDGTEYVLEVNAVPGWRAMARCLDVDVARLVLQYLLDKLGR